MTHVCVAVANRSGEITDVFNDVVDVFAAVGDAFGKVRYVLIEIVHLSVDVAEDFIAVDDASREVRDAFDGIDEGSAGKEGALAWKVDSDPPVLLKSWIQSIIST